jgi:myo-inositol-1(or 4)-monophosphatase
MSVDAHGVWDYLASLLIVQEAGGVAAEVDGRELVVLDHDARRTPAVASTPRLLDAILAERRRR